MVAPTKRKKRDKYIQVPVDANEKKIFEDNAELMGQSTAAWVRATLIQQCHRQREFFDKKSPPRGRAKIGENNQ